MNALKQWLVAESHLKQAASDFLDACANLRAAANQSFASTLNQLALENILDEVQSRIGAIESVESRMRESRAVLHALLNSSTSRVPINKLPPETLGQIFAIVAASSPCAPLDGRHDTFLDIPLVCVRWRQISSSITLLRSHIDLHFGPGSTADTLDHAGRRLDRCRGMPIHVHILGPPPRGQPDAVSTLKPHVASLSSLSARGVSAGLLQDLLALCSSRGTPGYLKTLVLSDIWVFDPGDIVSWPTSTLQGLVELELCNIDKDACPGLAELVAMLSHCPALHTLRLARLKIPAGPFQGHLNISLPCLRMLEISYVRGYGVPLPLMISPGTLELDVRFEARTVGSRTPSFIQSLLGRSNVVALTMNDIEYESPLAFRSYLPSLLRLRALHLNLLTSSSASVLGDLVASTPNGYTLQLPNLQSLCLSNGRISSVIMDLVKRVASTLCLRNLIFLSCTFPPSFDPELSDDEVNGRTIPGSNRRRIPGSTKEWLSERVGKVFVWETAPTGVCPGWTYPLSSY